MDLLRGKAALDGAERLLRADRTAIPAIAIDPAAREGQSITLLCMATPEEAVLIDPQATSGFAQIFAADRPFGAYRAKEVHRALLRDFGVGPSRWACPYLCEALLLGGRQDSLELDDVAARHGVEKPPPLEQGFEAFGAHTQRVATLIRKQIPALRADELTRVSRIEAAAVSPVATMEHYGMGFAQEAWKALYRQAEQERQELRKLLLAQFRNTAQKTLFGEASVNFDSDAELKAALHAMGHDVPNLRRGTLARLPPPLGPKLRRFRELGKAVHTYGESFLVHVGTDGRVHPTFEQIGASTGRMACHSPNLQAVVGDTPHRECFRPAPNRRLVIADYATCELRILAEMSGDPVFCDAFARGEDLHARVASTVFGKPVSKDHNPLLRQRAKAVSFGLVYGMGAGGLARAIGSDLRQAQSLLEQYFRTFPKIGAFLQDSAQRALEVGYASTLTGRRLYLDAGSDPGQRGQAERIAKNMPIQGTSADIIKVALAELHKALCGFTDAWLVNAVHDELVVDCDTDHSAAVAEAVRRAMEEAGARVLKQIPLAVDVTISRFWRK